MATWQELRDYVKSNYKIDDEQPDALRLIFAVGEERSQIVLIFHHTLMDGQEHWVQIESPIGKIADVEFPALMKEVANTVCGGVAAGGDFVTFRHSVPLENLDINEFERPLRLVVTTADHLENKLVGGDRY